MGFKRVYRCLQELFPQIDARALRAAAIEHSKDADAAVEAVLAEIIPFFDERSRSSIPLTESISLVHSPKEAIVPTDSVDYISGKTVDSDQKIFVNDEKRQALHDIDGKNEFFYDTDSRQHEGEDVTAETALSQNSDQNSIRTPTAVYPHCQVVLNDENGINILQNEVSVDPERNEKNGADKYPESSIKTPTDKSPYLKLENLESVDVGVNQIMTLAQASEEFDGHIDKENDQGKITPEGDDFMVGPAVVSSVQDITISPSESSVQLIVPPGVHGDNSNGTVGIEDESTLSGTLSESGEIRTMDVLEEIVADARNNKKTLFSTMESVISLMREVELKEQAAEQAKEDASKGGTDVLDKLKELEQMLQNAKEANDMHAGEVYGEKAILATELKELQSRVLFLSDERDKSLTVLDEMHTILEARLAAAENEIKFAEQEKLGKQKVAEKALADLEMDLQKVLQESDILKVQAEENAKLREFLVDRGCVVDILQGEIAVICQDVKLLKERLDLRVPLSKSLSSTQTSFILASSSSSSKSSIQDLMEAVAGQDDSMETPQNRDPANQVSTEDRKSVLEEDWDIL